MRTLIILAFAVSSAFVSAQTTIGFDNLGYGVVVTNQYPEATFSSSPGSEVRVTTLTGSGSSAPNGICTATINGGLTCSADIYIDFGQPVDLLSLTVGGDNAAGQAAEVRIFRQAVWIATVPVIVDGSLATRETTSLGGFFDVERIEIVNVTDPFGLDWDDIAFTLQPTCAQSGAVGSEVLTANGNLQAFQRLGIAQPFTISVAQPLTNPAPARMILWGSTTPLAAPFISPFGGLCLTPFHAAPGQPGLFTLVNGFAPDPSALLPGTVAPWSFSYPGLPFPLTFWLQGLIQHQGGASNTIATTNALRITIS